MVKSSQGIQISIIKANEAGSEKTTFQQDWHNHL